MKTAVKPQSYYSSSKIMEIKMCKGINDSFFQVSLQIGDSVELLL